MELTKKKFFTALIAASVLLMSGCDSFSVQHESKFEASASVESSGGDKGSSGSYKEAKSQSIGDVAFKVNDVNLLDGKTELNLSLTNKSGKNLTLTDMTISFKATDDDNKLLREGNCDFNKLSIPLPAGKEIYETFVIEDDKVKAYDEGFNVEYQITNVVTK